jgi:hypothetical protein
MVTEDPVNVSRGEIFCATLTSGISAECQKNLGKHLRGHMVTEDPVNVSRGSHRWL